MPDVSPTTPIQRLGRLIARYRKERGFSQEELAARCGLGRKAVSETETGRTAPTLLTLWTICKELDIPSVAVWNALDLRKTLDPRAALEDEWMALASRLSDADLRMWLRAIGAASNGR